MKRIYSTDLSDVEWECLEFHFPASNKRGRPKTHTAREILNAVFYVLRSGCPWRLLPYDFPPWETVYWWFLGDGEQTGPGNGSIQRCASACGDG
jgi:putative transposase